MNTRSNHIVSLVQEHKKFIEELNKCTKYFREYEKCVENNKNSFKKCHVLYFKDFENCIGKVKLKNEN